MQQYIKENGLQGLFPFKLADSFENPKESLLCESADGHADICTLTILSASQKEALVRYINGDIDFGTFLMQDGVPRDAILDTEFIPTCWCQVTSDDESKAFCLSVVTDLETSLSDIPHALCRLIAYKMNGQDPDAVLEEQELPLNIEESHGDWAYSRDEEITADEIEAIHNPDTSGNLYEEILNDYPALAETKPKETCFGDYVRPFHATTYHIQDMENKSLLYFGERLSPEAGDRICGLLNGDPEYARFPAGTFEKNHKNWYSINRSGFIDMKFALTLNADLRMNPEHIKEILDLLQEPDDAEPRYETAESDLNDD